MILVLLLSILLGIIAGTFTGLIPGIHINLIAVMVLTYLSQINPVFLATFVFSMAITHTFLNAIPSILLGAPDPDMALATLPGHSLLLKGHGYDAIKLTIIGSFLGLLVVIASIPLLLVFLKPFYNLIADYIGFLLLFVSLFIILKSRNKIKALFIFIASGILGFIALGSPQIKQPLFPLLSGLFGCGLLLYSAFKKTKIPKQKKKTVKINKKETIKALIGAYFSSAIITIFPAITPAIAATLSTHLMKNLTKRGYLLMLGAINTMAMFSSLIFLYTIQKSRNGAILAISKLIQINTGILTTLTFSALITAGLSALIALTLTKIIINSIRRINYSVLNVIVLIFLFAISIPISGPIGAILLVVSTSIGLLTNIWQVKRTTAMGCLLLPTIALYFGLF